MSSKISKYLLGLALLVIWAIVFLRIKARVNQTNVIPYATEAKEFESNITDEAYTLMLNYEDPFRIQQRPRVKKVTRSSNVAKPKKSNKSKLHQKKNKKEKPPAPLEFVYKGFIVVKGGQKVALINDGLKNYNLSIGERLDNALLVNIQEDSIKMKRGEAYFTFPKIN